MHLDPACIFIIKGMMAESIEKVTVGDWSVKEALDEGVEKSQKIMDKAKSGQ